MALLMSFDDAVRYLRRMVAADEEPKLDDQALADLLVLASTPDSAGSSPRNAPSVPGWQPLTDYLPGDLVAAQGRFWRCLNAGTSGAAEPSWVGDPVRDGSITWADNGAAWAPTYDLNKAASEGWALKAAGVAHKYDFTAGGQTFSRNQFIAHCLTMQALYRRRGMNTIQVGAP